MQIDIRLLPFYETPFVKAFPKIAELLKTHSITTPIEKDVSLYDQVDVLETLSHSPEISKTQKNALDPYLNKMVAIKEKARDKLLSRSLNELDQILYELEDAFEDLENGL
jgi:hypothetical protein